MWQAPPLQLEQLPQQPGVYLMLGDKQILYIGKARNLRKRVSSYFLRPPNTQRLCNMVRQIVDININITNSESAALVLEHNLIKEHQPPYNIMLKDDKSYPYILLTHEKTPRLLLHHNHNGKQEQKGDYFGPYPHAKAVYSTLYLLQIHFGLRQCEDSVFFHRSRPCLQHQIGRCCAPCCDVVSESEYADLVAQIKRLLTGNDDSLIKDWEMQMQAAAQVLDFEQAANLRDRIFSLRTLISSNSSNNTLPADADALLVIRHASGVWIQIGMRRRGLDLGSHLVKIEAKQAIDASDDEVLTALFSERYKQQAPKYIILHHEQANEKCCADLHYLLGLFDIDNKLDNKIKIQTPKRGDAYKWLQNLQNKATDECEIRSDNSQQAGFSALADLFAMEKTPQLIAAVDNAHIGGKQMVAAVVYYNHKGACKQYYRHYSLDTAKGEQDKPLIEGDDYGAMLQVMQRFGRAVFEESLPAPDLMFIDGGRGQLNVAKTAMEAASCSHIPLVAIAKGAGRKVGNETFWLGWSSGETRKPGKHNAGLLLAARVRDEAHRFANVHLRKRHKKKVLRSALDDIAGIGKTRRMHLLRHFGGIEGVRRASREDIAAVTGFSHALAEHVFTALHR
ncbi:MAG: excinuclease ABC subunit UvrC [Mariprofundales bacterium]